jgi:hypothetical protein
MTEVTFDFARSRGTDQKIGQLNPLGRYGVAPGEFAVGTLVSGGSPSIELATVALFLASGRVPFHYNELCADPTISR